MHILSTAVCRELYPIITRDQLQHAKFGTDLSSSFKASFATMFGFLSNIFGGDRSYPSSASNGTEIEDKNTVEITTIDDDRKSTMSVDISMVNGHSSNRHRCPINHSQMVL